MNNYIIFTESSPNVGGQELQLMQQMRAFQAQGYACTLACRPGGRVETTARQQGLNTVAVPFRNSLHLPSILRLCALFRTSRPSMVICHSGHDTNNAAIASRLVARRPFVLRSRTYLTGKNKAFSYNHLVDATMVPSAFLKRSLLANPEIRADKIHVVYPGIDFSRIDEDCHAPIPEAVASWLAASDGPLLLHVAMLRGEKGHLLLLDALAGLISLWPTLRYLIAGEGTERALLERRIAELGLQRHVLLAGPVVPATALYPHADLLVMPSLFEPLGMSQIEALALRIPVLASRTGGIPETIIDGETGCLVDPGKPDAWISAIDHALRARDEMKRMASAGCADVRARFSVDSNLQQIIELQANFNRGHPR
jgi:glycosyltransferase involved in cell wall biosynthesis